MNRLTYDGWVEEAVVKLSKLAPAEYIHVADGFSQVTAHAPSRDGASGVLGHLGPAIAIEDRTPERQEAVFTRGREPERRRR